MNVCQGWGKHREKCCLQSATHSILIGQQRFPSQLWEATHTLDDTTARDIMVDAARFATARRSVEDRATALDTARTARRTRDILNNNCQWHR